MPSLLRFYLNGSFADNCMRESQRDKVRVWLEYFELFEFIVFHQIKMVLQGKRLQVILSK
jgi:hypothetical protein